MSVPVHYLALLLKQLFRYWTSQSENNPPYSSYREFTVWDTAEILFAALL